MYINIQKIMQALLRSVLHDEKTADAQVLVRGPDGEEQHLNLYEKLTVNDVKQHDEKLYDSGGVELADTDVLAYRKRNTVGELKTMYETVTGFGKYSQMWIVTTSYLHISKKI